MTGEQIRAARMARGLSGEKLAELCGIEPKTLGRIERGGSCTPATMALIEGKLAALPEKIVTQPHKARRQVSS